MSSTKNESGVTMRERMMRALACKENDRPPVAGMTTAGTTQMMDYCGAAWPDVHSDAKKMATLALAAYPFLGLESARVPYCLSYEAEALGCKVFLGTKNSTPMVKSHPYKDKIDNDEDLELPKASQIPTMARNGVILDAIKLVKKDLGERPFIVGVTGPFTIAGHLVGTENLLLWIATEPEKVHRIVKFASDYEREWLKIMDTMGVEAIQMSEPSASWDMLSAEMFEEYALPYVRNAVGVMENTKRILHICGNMTEQLDNMIATGVEGLSLEEKCDTFRAAKIVNGRAALVGNVGVVRPLLQGTPEQVREKTMESINAGFNIISAGCGLSALIDKANLKAMVDTVKSLPPKKR